MNRKRRVAKFAYPAKCIRDSKCEQKDNFLVNHEQRAASLTCSVSSGAAEVRSVSKELTCVRIRLI
jgi:hypothetical protein